MRYDLELYWEQLTGWSCLTISFLIKISNKCSGQVAEKQNLGELGKKIDDQQQRKHFESWESYWGRPGNGAPRNIAHKENLIKMLHFPPASEKVRQENILNSQLN